MCRSGKGCTSVFHTLRSCRGCRAFLCKPWHQRLKMCRQDIECTLQLRGRWSLPGRIDWQNTSRPPWCRSSCQGCLRTSPVGKGCRLLEPPSRRHDRPCFLPGIRSHLRTRKRQPPQTTFRDRMVCTSLCQSRMWRHAHHRCRRDRPSLGTMWRRTRSHTCLLGTVCNPPRRQSWRLTCRRSRAGTWCLGTSDHLRLPRCLPCSCCTWLQS